MGGDGWRRVDTGGDRWGQVEIGGDRCMTKMTRKVIFDLKSLQTDRQRD